MSLRSFFSRLLSQRTLTQNTTNPHKNGAKPNHRWRHYLWQFFITTALMLSAIWLLMAIWYQLGAKNPMSYLATLVIIGLLSAIFLVIYEPKLIARVTHGAVHRRKIRKWLTGSYALVWLIGAGWFMSISPMQQRDWQADVSERLSYERDADNPNLITLHNVRNFDWKNGGNADNADDATERWESRTIDVSQLSGVDVINSYWMGPLIAHTLVSFRFEDDRPLSLSLEIRKEKGESFSALGGFFKRFELSLIAAEERDIIYTRTNARGEQVYLFPVSHLRQAEVKSLFESYLTAADELNTKPSWYNTLTSNCTNIIFYMARMISGERLPWDYRIWVSGWLPNYLYDVGMLDAAPNKDGQPWSMETWYERAHINPKVRGFDNRAVHSSAFSDAIRHDIPQPTLAKSKAQAELQAQSAASASNP